MARKRIGELLVERGAVTPAQLEEGLAHHRQNRVRLGVALIQKGFITEDQLANVLAEALGLQRVDLKTETPDWAAVHMLRARFCEQHELFPYALESIGGRKQLCVAMSDPLNVPAIEEIEFTTGLKVNARMAPISEVRAAILRYYHKINPEEAPARALGDDHPQPTIELDEVIIEGELLEATEPNVRREVTARTALADLIKQHEQKARKKKQAKGPAKGGDPLDALSKDLDYLFGVRDEPDQVEQLERKFWALMRIMAKKGLITKDEFAEALGELDRE